MTTQTRAALDAVARYAAAKSRQDIAAALACCTDDFVLETIPFGTRANGTAEAALQLGVFFAAFPDYRVTVDGQAAGPDAVAAWGTVRATMRGPFGSFAPTGRAFALPFACVFPLRAGLLAGERFFFDLDAMCEQLGLSTSAVTAELRALRGESPRPDDAADFVARFAEFWRPPVRLERVANLLHPDARLITPGLPDVLGVDGAIASFEQVFALVPDFSVEPLAWRGDREMVFIELRLTGTVGGQRLSIPAIDRFLLRDGKATERVSFFDRSQFAAAVEAATAGGPAEAALGA
jgi:ketosteroid isomerase-like protein